MSVIAAVNLPDKLVLLEDGRELNITQFYRACPDHDTLGPLTAKSELRSCCRVNGHQQAEVFTVDIPGADAALIVEIAAISLTKPSQIN
jgi:hypothetical protein